MNSQEEFQLRMAVFHHPTLKIQQLCGFLTSECDDFLKNELPQSLLVRELFTSSFQPIQSHTDLDLNEYIGVIILYSSSSAQTVTYAKDSLTLTNNMDNTFRILVQMDNSQKQMNIVGGQGETLALKHKSMFIRLNLYNSDELVNNLNRNIYLMVQGYYYPNEDDKHKQSMSYEVQASPSQFQLNYLDGQEKIIASDEKQKVMEMIEQVALLRTSREKEILAEQQAIDESIQNVQKVLNNINRHIKTKFQSNWFTSLRDSLYKPVEKQSRFYNKIKLTQEFIDDNKPKALKVPLFKSRKFMQSIHNSKYNYDLQRSLRKLDSSLIKVVIFLETSVEGSHTMAEIQIYENSRFDQLASNALRKLGLRENQHNMRLMLRQIQNKVETYVKQLSKKVQQFQRQRTYQKSYLAVSKK